MMSAPRRQLLSTRLGKGMMLLLMIMMTSTMMLLLMVMTMASTMMMNMMKTMRMMDDECSKKTAAQYTLAWVKESKRAGASKHLSVNETPKYFGVHFQNWRSQTLNWN